MKETKVNKINTELETKGKVNEINTDIELLKSKIKSASEEINLVLAKYRLEFVVAHKLIVNQELKQEEIAHDIVLRPTK